MGTSRFKGPLLGSTSAMAGAMEDAPIHSLGETEWVTYFNDFTQVDKSYIPTTDWSATVFTAGTQTIAVDVDDLGIGILRLDGGAGTNQGVVTQLDGSAAAGRAPIGYDFAAGSGSAHPSECFFACRFRILDVDKQSVFVGLAELHGTSNVLLTSTSTLTASDNHIGFHQIDTDDGALRFTTAGTAVANLNTDTSVLPSNLLDGGWIEVAVRASGTLGYSGYIRTPGGSWTKVAGADAGTAWNEQMVITLGNMGTGAGDDLDVDYVLFARKRDVVIP